MTPEELQNFKDWGVPLPNRDAHVKDGDQQWEKPQLKNWRLEGNILKADSTLGVHGWHIPTDYIMDGLDEQGLPKLRKLIL